MSIPSLAQIGRYAPLLFTLTLIITLYCIYICHCIILLQFDIEFKDIEKYTRGIIEICVFHVIFLLVLYNYILCLTTEPGSIPNTQEWNRHDNLNITGNENITENNDNSIKINKLLPIVHEYKNSGERRYCKWCCLYKPDRSHHCRVCRKCVLKMDHHCPWVHNCIGYYNYKYFFNLLLYSFITCNYISISMIESVNNIFINDKNSIFIMFFLLFGETLSIFIGILVTGFFIFHIWLGVNGLSTIEFCEKANQEGKAPGTSYNMGVWKNFSSSLGKNPFLWCIPTSTKDIGNGLFWEKKDISYVNHISNNIRKRLDSRL
eukprot:GHVL01007198.1.p1 GENE.GHVL01007198.1~~GHVL01007198.1.p1  ORF type:complete len:319 (+),score=55.94 GHVL01007198.1:626-1582(+)